MDVSKKTLVRFAVTQAMDIEQGVQSFTSIRRNKDESLDTFQARARAEFGDGALILFKHEGGHVAFKTKAGNFYPG